MREFENSSDGDPNYCGRRAYNFRKSAHADATEKVSVIIPAFSEKKSVKSNIELLTDQDYPSHEVILVDDGSPDRTLEIARALRRPDSESTPPGKRGKA